MTSVQIYQYLDAYAVKIAVYMMNFDPENHEFEMNLDDSKGGVTMVAIENPGEDETRVERHFSIVKDMKKDCKPSKVQRDFLAKTYKAVSLAKYPFMEDQQMSKKQTIAFCISQKACEYANEARLFNVD